MRSNFDLRSSACSWCSDDAECVAVELDSGVKMDLCWKCLKKKAQAERKAKNGKPKAESA